MPRLVLRKQHVHPSSTGFSLQSVPFQRDLKPRHAPAVSGSGGGGSHGVRAYFQPHVAHDCEQSTIRSGGAGTLVCQARVT